MKTLPRAQSIERILVRGVNWLGDAVMTTPALIRLREALPKAHITLLTRQKLAGLWGHHPAVNEILPCAESEGVWTVAGKIRTGRFQVGVILPNSHRSAIELWLGRVPNRIGLATPFRRWLLTQPQQRPSSFVRMRKRSVDEIKQLTARASSSSGEPLPDIAFSGHHIHHYLHLAAVLGGNIEPLPPKLHVTEEEVREVSARFLDRAGNSLREPSTSRPPPWFALIPGAEYGPAKRWPRENFVAAAREVSRVTGCRWLILGGAADGVAADDIAREVGDAAVNLAGKTTLRELMALLRFSRVVLTNDTGPMHLAAAVGTRVVALFGSTSPGLTGPGLPGDTRHRLLCSRVECSPCFRRDCPIDFRCMARIEAGQVVGAVLEVYEQIRNIE